MNAPHPPERGSADEARLRLMDSIVGRCVRDPEFGAAVLAHPEAVLAPFNLTVLELDDFRALAREIRPPDEAWKALSCALWPAGP